MRSTLEDIVSRLRHGDYKNEEHVRLAIVCRLLSKLGWDIWNPIEVNTEFATVRDEDNSRVDVAILMPPQYLRPAIFIEVKAVGKLTATIESAERQLRDYNRTNKAEILVLTDGQLWRFYLASAPGVFHQTCFEQLDLLDESSALDDIELTLDAFLSRDALQQGSAVKEARSYLKRTDTQRTMFDVLPTAQRDAEEDPSLSRIECLLKRCLERGVECSRDEAQVFFRDLRHRPAASPISHSSGNSTPRKELLTHSNTLQLERTANSSSADVVLSIQGRRGTNATGKNLSSGRFVVFADSVAGAPSPGFVADGRGYYPLFRDLVSNKILVPEDRSGSRIYRLTRDYEFSSSSAAASVFLGTSASGPREWKQK